MARQCRWPRPATHPGPSKAPETPAESPALLTLAAPPALQKLQPPPPDRHPLPCRARQRRCCCRHCQRATRLSGLPRDGGRRLRQRQRRRLPGTACARLPRWPAGSGERAPQGPAPLPAGHTPPPGVICIMCTPCRPTIRRCELSHVSATDRRALLACIVMRGITANYIFTVTSGVSLARTHCIVQTSTSSPPS